MQRLFVAIELPALIREQLGEIQDQLRNCTNSGRFVHKDNLHLTLQFLGDVADRQISGIAASLHQTAGKHASFLLTLGAPGVFGGSNHCRVAWLGVAGDVAALCRLQGDIAASLAGLGFAGDYDKYRPHITLARDVVFGGTGREEWFAGRSRKQTFPVRHFALMASLLSGGKRVYRAVRHFPLGEKGEKPV